MSPAAPRFIGLRCCLPALLIVACWANAAPADDGIPPETLKALKEATTFVKVDAGRLGSAGSGFLVVKEGTTGYIVTNEHVVVPPKSVSAKPAVSVVFRSGTKQEQVVPAQIVVVDAARDLALLKVTGVKDLPQPVDLTKKAELKETMPVYIFGFPFGEALATNDGNPAITIGKGTISSLREDNKGAIALVQIDGAINPGNSGGPVLDASGRLVGVSVATIRGTGIGIAIPPAQVSSLLFGRVNDSYRTIKIDKGIAEIEAVVELIDPLSKIRSVTLLHVGGRKVGEMPKADKDGAYAALVGAEKVSVKIENQKGTIRIKVPYDKANARVVFQPSYLTSDGIQQYAKALAFDLGDPDIKAVLVGTWKVKVGPTFQTEWTFSADGTVASTNGDFKTGKWTVEETRQRILVSWSERVWETMSLPLNPKLTLGTSCHSTSWRVEAVKVK